ncbi:protein export chaperone SecB [Microbulbifer sp.]|uniref:protein export chaperone SecB n=1 Tax=Microbulbifer sp. TaxID=1908541 RepID=UPI00259087C9|nr:protein export chaperone SecB [Microbulbifer sp.]
MKQWSEIKPEFGVDGSLRDIYIENVDASVWGVFIDGVKQSSYKFDFTHGDIERDLPGSLNQIKVLQETNPTTLHLWLSDSIQINCHFFIESEIELDLSPSEIQSASSYSKLIDFLEWLASITERAVKLTHEGAQEQVILSVCK